MKVLHLFSNWKWTGPAEPAVRLAGELSRRHEVSFACGHCPHKDLENLVLTEARLAGLDVIDGLTLRKHFDPLTGMRDLHRLASIIADRGFEIVHTHLLNDHLLGGAAVRRAGVDARVVRTVYGGPDLSARIRTRLAFSRFTDGVVAASNAAAELIRAKTRLPDERRFEIPGAVDTERFLPEHLSSLREAAREELGLASEDVAVGIVARVQRHRRFDLLLDAFAQAVQVVPRLKLLLIGRGTRIEAVAREPARRLGIEGRVVFTGYRSGQDYESLLSALDVGLFLVPGSDGSCRAARELCAADLPVVVSERPPLPEIVVNGETGFVVPEEASALAGAFEMLANDGALRRRLGKAAGERARRDFSLKRQASDIEGVYRTLLDQPIWRRT